MKQSKITGVTLGAVFGSKIRLATAVCAALVLTAAPVAAQEAILSGSVTDATSAVLPGVTVTATHIETGTVYTSVSDERGEYRIPALRPGVYDVRAELPSFSTVRHAKVEFQVGQRAQLNFRLTLSSIEESVTVTGQSPLVDVTQSKMGGNIDTRQMQELPLNGRNWLDLTMLAPGSRVNAVANDAVLGTSSDTFQLNVDGQQVTSTIAGSNFGQPRFSRDAIGEFEFITSRFDATQGRSAGVQVNAITKAGTNNFAGTLSGYFRDDALIAKDLVVGRVLPYSNQQVSATFGGPLRRDRAHFFGYYEGEREPKTYVYTTAWQSFNLNDVTEPRTEHKAGARLDASLGASTRGMLRWNLWRHNQLENAGGTAHPARANEFRQKSNQVFGTLTQTFGSTRVNDIKIGYAYITSQQDPVIPSPEIMLSGLNVGAVWFMPLFLEQGTYSIRDDFTWVSSKHELKMGGEFLYPDTEFYWPSNARGRYIANLGPPPANVEALFPVWNDPSTWNLGALTPLTRRYIQGFGNFTVQHVQRQFAAWVQDNWRATSNLTLNLGLRYDYYHDALANSIDYQPWRSSAPNDKLNFAPRLGFAYSLHDGRTVFRGGWGLYFSGVRDQWTHHGLFQTQTWVVELDNTGRPNFNVDPFNRAAGGAPPASQEEALRSFRLSGNGSMTADNAHTPYTHQTSVGVQKQLGDTTSFQADYVWTAGRRLEDSRQMNLTFDPATGANRPFSNPDNRAFPNWGSFSMRFADGRSNYHGLETAFTKRMSANWQLSATYTLSGTWDDDPLPLFPGCAYAFTAPGVCNVPVTLAEDFGSGFILSAGDQRHRAVFNGIWQLPYSVQLSGLYFYGSGVRYGTTYGADLRDSGGLTTRLRPNGTIAPRNGFVGDPLHRVDGRITRRFTFGGVSIEGMAEVFNLFNHENFGAYTLSEVLPTFGRPVQNLNVAYASRTAQFGFRVAF